MTSTEELAADLIVIGALLASPKPHHDPVYYLICHLYFRLAYKNKPQLASYCSITYPDVCICGKIFSDTGNNLRRHCSACQGKHSYLDSVEYHGLSHSSGKYLNQSWLEYSIAYGVYNVRGFR